MRFTVRDSGIGISQDVQNRLFNRFEQGDNSNTRTYGGTGLGLAISKQLAGLLGGSVGVESVPREGSTFWVEIPVDADLIQADPAPEIEVAKPQRDASNPLAGVTALIVDDNAVNLRILDLLLKAFGAQVTQALCGAKAVEILGQQSFDIVLMDVNMPGMTGSETTDAIRKLGGANASVPVIAVTAHTMNTAEEKALVANMDGYLAKPIESAKLCQVVSETLGLETF